MFLVLVVHWVSGDGMGIDNREGLDGKRLLECGLAGCFCNLVSIDGQHAINSLVFLRFILWLNTAVNVNVERIIDRVDDRALDIIQVAHMIDDRRTHGR